MNKIPYYLSIVLLFWGCIQSNAIDALLSDNAGSGTNPGIVYDSNSGLFLESCSDPYSIENLEKARKLLLDGESSIIITKSDAELISSISLSPTHHALTVFPKNLETISALESTEGVSIAYFPFNKRIVGSIKDGTNLQLEHYCYEKNPHSLNYTNVKTTNGEFISVLSESLPVIYVVWPIESAIPDTLDYRIDYDVALPSSSTTIPRNELRAINHIRRESIRQSLGLVEKTKSPNEPNDSINYKGVGGRILCFDNYTNSYQGIGGLTLYFQLGSLITYGSTSIDGSFSVLDEIPDGSTFYCSYSKAWKWSIRWNNSTTPVHHYFGNIEDVLGQGVQYNYNLSLYPYVLGPTNQISRAVSFYFSSLSHDVTPFSIASPIIIKSMGGSNSTSNGFTSFPSNSIPFITIYNNNSAYNAKVIGTSLHEQCFTNKVGQPLLSIMLYHFYMNPLPLIWDGICVSTITNG